MRLDPVLAESRMSGSSTVVPARTLLLRERTQDVLPYVLPAHIAAYCCDVLSLGASLGASGLLWAGLPPFWWLWLWSE